MASILPYGFGRNLTRWPFDDFFEPLSTVAESDAFAMDVEDAGDSYVVTAELPGVTRDQIDVELNEGRLSIAVDKKESQETKDKNYLHKETGEWSATRSVYLKDAATQGLTARYADGVLTVTVPKQSAKPNATKIAID